jgi:hypothetical protein
MDREPSRLAALRPLRRCSKFPTPLVLSTRCDRGPVAVRLSAVSHTIGHVLNLLGIENDLLKRWGE